eukprot:UN24923
MESDIAKGIVAKKVKDLPLVFGEFNNRKKISSDEEDSDDDEDDEDSDDQVSDDEEDPIPIKKEKSPATMTQSHFKPPKASRLASKTSTPSRLASKPPHNNNSTHKPSTTDKEVVSYKNSSINKPKPDKNKGATIVNSSIKKSKRRTSRTVVKFGSGKGKQTQQKTAPPPPEPPEKQPPKKDGRIPYKPKNRKRKRITTKKTFNKE